MPTYPSNPPLEKIQRPRLLGIDLIRGLAVYAVVLLHSDEIVATPPWGWEMILEFAGFAVPFFLAASFYFAMVKIQASSGEYVLTPRITRLLTPYIVWTLVYLFYKSAKYVADNELVRLNTLFQDPIPLMFFGSAAFHLYFLPLLLSGTLLIKPLSLLIKRHVNLGWLMGLLALSMVGYELMLLSGNGFQSLSGVAFQGLFDSVGFPANENPLIRVSLVTVAWMMKCLPYILTAMVMVHPSIKQTFLRLVNRYTLLWIFLFVCLNLGGGQFLPRVLYELTRGYTALFVAISISNYLHRQPIIQHLGICSFGIYLSHLLVVEAFQIVGSRISPALSTQASSVTLIAIATMSFLISWLLTAILRKRKFLSKLMFGA